MMEMAREERENLADLLAQLTPQQWEQPSLCERWRVRDVVAHMIGYDELGRQFDGLRRTGRSECSGRRCPGQRLLAVDAQRQGGCVMWSRT